MDRITVVPGFGFYKRGFDKIVNLIPSKLLYKKFIREHYDLEIAFQFGIPTKMIAVSNNPHKLCWMHTYDAQMTLKKYYSKFPMIINVAKAGRDKLIEAGFEESKCEYCYNIIDEENILSASKEPCNYEKKHKYCFITVARLAPDKAFMRYLECIKDVVSKTNDIEFLIVGGGSEEEKMRRFIKENCLEEFVIMTGKQSNPYKYMSKADLYFCCSYREGFSTACQEAALMGIPVVSVEVDGARELIDLTESGCVIENKANSIVSKIIEISNNSEMILEWQANAKKNKILLYKEARINKICYTLKRIMTIN